MMVNLYNGLNESNQKKTFKSKSLLNDSNIIIELGQSNMVGQDGDDTNPSYPFPDTNGFYFDGTVQSQLLANSGTSTGSQSTYFADKYFELFGEKPIIVKSAASSSAMNPIAASPHWGVGSSLRVAAENKVLQALSFYSELEPKAVLWCQGETDGKEYDNYATRQDAKDALQSIIDWWFNLYPSSVFLISQTGLHNSGSWSVGLTAIQEIQQEICDENERVFMAFDGAKDFVIDGKMIDYIHYNYVGLQDMGEAFANKLFEIN